MPSQVSFFTVLFLILNPSAAGLSAQRPVDHRRTFAGSTMAPLKEEDFTFGQSSSANWTKSSFLPKVDSLYDHVTKKFGRWTTMTRAQLTQIQLTWACLGIHALQDEQIERTGNQCKCVPGRAGDGRRPSVAHVGSCTHGNETQHDTTCPAGIFCQAATTAASQASGLNLVHLWLNLNASCIRAFKHCISGSLGRLLDAARVKILICTKLIYEAYFNLLEIGSVVSSTSTAAILLSTMHFSALYGVAAQWQPQLAQWFYARVWLVPYYNACCGCTASPFTWSALYKLEHMGMFMAGLLSAMMGVARNAGLRLNNAIVAKAVGLLRDDESIAGRLKCGGISFATWVAAFLSGATSRLHYSETRPPVDCAWCKRPKDMIKRACIVGADVICRACATHWSKYQKRRTPEMERHWQERLERQRGLTPGLAWSCSDCPYLIQGTLERTSRARQRANSGEETTMSVRTTAGLLRLGPSSAKPGLPTVTICEHCRIRGLKGMHSAAALVDLMALEGKELTPSQSEQHELLIKEARLEADSATVRSNASATMLAHWLIYVMIKDGVVAVGDEMISMEWRDPNTRKLHTCTGSFTEDCQMELYCQGQEPQKVQGPTPAVKQFGEWCGRQEVHGSYPPSLTRTVYTFVKYRGQPLSAYRSAVMEKIIARVEHLRDYAAVPLALADDDDEFHADDAEDAKEVAAFLDQHLVRTLPNAPSPAGAQLERADSLPGAVGDLQPRLQSVESLQLDEGFSLEDAVAAQPGFFPGTGEPAPSSPFQQPLPETSTPARPAKPQVVDLARTTSSPQLAAAHPAPLPGGVDRNLLANAALFRQRQQFVSKRGLSSPIAQPTKRATVARSLQLPAATAGAASGAGSQKDPIDVASP
ncbi:hypothetical protein WJX73_000486 [Symbiochloris irregularis]|uniref:Uncharacterized protein n=1 Tax=Symbiochloris irregularis TaxID=706552 RepID=A0AAW1NVM8_9CHLO